MWGRTLPEQPNARNAVSVASKLKDDAVQLKQEYLRRARVAWRTVFEEELELSSGKALQESYRVVDDESVAL